MVVFTIVNNMYMYSQYFTFLVMQKFFNYHFQHKGMYRSNMLFYSHFCHYNKLYVFSLILGINSSNAVWHCITFIVADPAINLALKAKQIWGGRPTGVLTHRVEGKVYAP